MPERAVRERGTGTIRTLYDSTSTSVFKDSAWNWLIFKDFQGLAQGLSNSKDLQALSQVLTYFEGLSKALQKGAFKLQGPSSAAPSSDLFLRTFKGLMKKGLWNSKAFHISFNQFQRLSKPCHVRTALPKPESTQAKINLMHLNTENFTISVNTQHDPIHLSTLCSSHPQSTIPR